MSETIKYDTQLYVSERVSRDRQLAKALQEAERGKRVRFHDHPFSENNLLCHGSNCFDVKTPEVEGE